MNRRESVEFVNMCMIKKWGQGSGPRPSQS